MKTIMLTEEEHSALLVYLDVALDNERTWDRFAEAMSEGEEETEDTLKWKTAFNGAMDKLLA